MGWVMVASGLQDLVYVSHLRLAVHFMMAMLVLAALVWVGLEQLVAETARGGPAKLRKGTLVLLFALTVQLTLGASPRNQRSGSQRRHSVNSRTHIDFGTVELMSKSFACPRRR